MYSTTYMLILELDYYLIVILTNENIFDIIMPWQEEQFQEEQEKLEELLQLGKISEKEHKERQKNKKDESKPQPNAGNK